MQYRRFGRTELQMPVFSCGGMRYQYQWDDLPLEEVPAANQAHLEATVRRAVELGIHHIETARGYGSSERQLGLVLPMLPRDKLIVQTKITPAADTREFLQQFNESLDRLRLDYVDLLGLHGINNYKLLHWAMRPGGCLEAARGLVQEGKVRHVGFSTHGDPDLVLAAVREESFGGFDYVNLHWYFIYQRNWSAIQAAVERDLGVFIISPADKGGMLYQPPQRLVELCQPLHPLVFNCLFCLSRPEVHTLSVGAARPSDFDLQCSTLNLLDQADQLLPPIVERLHQAVVDAVGSDLAERYREGLPDWEEAPGYMNLGVMLWLRNLFLAYDLREYAKMRYNLLGNGGHWFPGLNAGQIKHLDLTEALAKSPFKDQIPDWLAELHTWLFEAPQKRLSQN